MNLLITGGAGFIGSHLCDSLISANNITVIDNLSLGRIENIKHLLSLPNFNFIQSDILDEDKTKDVFERGHFDMVFHLAANSDIQKGVVDPNVDFKNTFLTTYTILSMMKEFNVKKLFFASTSAIYGETREILTENFGPLKPVSSYGASKLASEAYISSFSSNYDIQTWIARFPNVVGERFTHGVIFDFIAKLKKNPNELVVLGNGEQCKPYIYVKDLVEAIIFEISNSNDQYNVFNIGPGTRTKVKDIAKIVIEEMNLCPKIKYTGGDRGWKGDVPEFRYDTSKLENLGFKLVRDSDDAVRTAVRQALLSK